MTKYVVLLLLLLFCTWSRGATAGAGTREPSCGTAARLSYCRYSGDGPPLILLTGLGNTMKSWPPSFVHALNDIAALVVSDRKGYGASEPLTKRPVTARDAAADLDALLTELGLRRVVLVGHSLGGRSREPRARRVGVANAPVAALSAHPAHRHQRNRPSLSAGVRSKVATDPG